jgi:hypothetical protein
MSKVSKFIPVITICGGFTIAILDAYTEARFNPNLVTALIYAGLGSSAAVGFSKYWRKQ